LGSMTVVTHTTVARFMREQCRTVVTEAAD